jgi:LacI family transcriptional regulator
MRSSKTVNIRDVARAARVSAGTVSRALSGSPLVNEETRAKIMEVVKALGYAPHPSAQRLSTGKTFAIGLIAPFFTRPSVTERLNGAVSLLVKNHYDLVIHDIETPEQRQAGFLDIIRRERVDGVLILSMRIHDQDAQLIKDSELPVVLVDTDHPALAQLNRLVVDDVAGGRVATEYLLQLGHTRIGFIGDYVENPLGFVSSRNRRSGYCQALEQAGVPVRPEYYSEGEHGRPFARLQARQMLSQPMRPTAIFAASDTQAIGVLEAARDLALRVPDDLSVIGYDDIEFADILQLTTMHQNLAESGRLGVQLLLDSIANPQLQPIYRVLPTELVVRRTTAPVSDLSQ